MLRNLNVSLNGRRCSSSPQVGVPASAIPTGGALPAWLLNDIDAGFPNRLYNLTNVSQPSAGNFVMDRRGVGLFSGAPDGTYPGTFTVEKFDSGVGLVSTADGTYSLVVGSGVSTPVPTVTSVSITPSSVTLTGLGTQQFTAQALGLNNPDQGMTWTKQSGVGIVSNTGLYTAPAGTSNVQTAVLRATSTVNNTKYAEVTVTISANVVTPPSPTVTGVVVSPETKTMNGGTTFDFDSTVTGTNNPPQSVTWSITAGVVNSDGLVTAPTATNVIQLITLTATSTLNGTKKGTAIITVPALVVIPDEPVPGHTVKVSIRAVDQQGNLLINAPITCILDKVDVDPVAGYVLPEKVEILSDETGLAELHLWPNARGSHSSKYIIVIENPDTGDALRIDAVIPDNDCVLHQVAVPKN